MRWLSMLLPLALLFGMLGRGHLLQTMGLAIACEHPEEAQAEPLPADTPAGSSDGHDHCPPDCHRCPCGQMPVVPPVDFPLLTAIVEFHELPAWFYPDELGQSHPHRLDRPPRHPAV